MLGIDTPETKAPATSVQCFGPEATAAAEQLLSGAQVWIATDPTQDTYDRYDRLLAYVWVGDDLVNLDLIEGGYATEYTYDQPYAYQDVFRAAEDLARRNGTGWWSICSA